MDGKHIKILLVEDNPGDARLIEEYLSESKYSKFECIWVQRLEEALETWADIRPDVVLLDLSLPGSRGFETFAKAYAEISDRPIVVLTGLDDELLAVKTVDEGAQDYLVKGHVDASLLERVVRYAMGRHKIQRELREARDAAEAASRAKSAFLRNMSHELKTPLTAILGYAELLLHEVAGPLNDQQKKASESIHRSGKHLMSLISDLLDLAKVEVGKVQVDLGPVDLRQVIDWSLPMVSDRAMKNKVELSAEISDGLSHVLANERAVRQVMLNLLTNAIKFSPEGGEVSITTRTDGDQVIVDVADTGLGISPDEIEKVFDPFERSEREDSRRIEGTGLGLPLVKGLLVAMGGTIEATSVLGTGSCFTFTLPVFRSD